MKSILYIILLSLVVGCSTATNESQSLTDLKTQKTELVNQLNNIPSDSTFKSFAENNNLLVREDVNIDDMKFNITALENSRDIVKWMFNENTKVGDVSISIYTDRKSVV